MGQLQPTKSSNILDSYAKRKIPFEDKDGYPCSAPPWGELMAIDANTADMVWRVPLGEYKELTGARHSHYWNSECGRPHHYSERFDLYRRNIRSDVPRLR